MRTRILVGRRDWNKHSRNGQKSPTSGKKQLLKNDRKEWVRVEDYAPAIVDVATWDMVQARLKADSDEYARKHNANETKQYLLSGLLR